MKHTLPVLLLASCSMPATDNFNRPFPPQTPVDIRRFVIDLQGCNHFSGEPTGGDPDRVKFLAKRVKQLCVSIEDRERLLLDRYRGRPDLQAIIRDD